MRRREEGRVMVVMWQELRTGDKTTGYRNKKCGVPEKEIQVTRKSDGGKGGRCVG
jgi:hypothetical protein